MQLGCTVTPAEDCIVSDTCVAEAAALVECWAENPTGCMCEEDDADLNCEGTVKDDEGPAELGTPCLEAADAYRACAPDEDEEEETNTSEAGEGAE